MFCFWGFHEDPGQPLPTRPPWRLFIANEVIANLSELPAISLCIYTVVLQTVHLLFTNNKTCPFTFDCRKNRFAGDRLNLTALTVSPGGLDCDYKATSTFRFSSGCLIYSYIVMVYFYIALCICTVLIYLLKRLYFLVSLNPLEINRRVYCRQSGKVLIPQPFIPVKRFLYRQCK